MKKKFRWLLVGLLGVVMLPAGVASATAYPYTANTTLDTFTPAAGGTLTVGIEFITFPDFPSGYADATEYEIVLCPDDGTAFPGFSCYVVSDSVQRNGAFDGIPPAQRASHEGEDVTGGQRLWTSWPTPDCIPDPVGSTSNTTCSVPNNSTTTVRLPPRNQLPPAITANQGRAIIQVQSVRRYGDDGTVCVNNTETGVVGVDKGVFPGDQPYPAPCEPNNGAVNEGDPVCQPACTKYNGTPRLVDYKRIEIR